jgi:hypothetical protein
MLLNNKHYYNLSSQERKDLWKHYKKAYPNMGYSDMVNHFHSEVENYQFGGKEDKYVTERDATSTVKTPAIATNNNAFKEKVYNPDKAYKYAIDAAGTVFYPASLVGSAIDFYQGDNIGGVAGLIPFGKGYKFLKASKYAGKSKMAQKANSGLNKIMGAHVGTQVYDAKSDLVDPIINKNYQFGGRTDYFNNDVKKYKDGGEDSPFAGLKNNIPKNRLEAESKEEYKRMHPEIEAANFYNKIQKNIKQTSEIYQSGPNKGQPTGKGALEPSYPEMALLPSSLPLKATSRLGKAALFAAETLNPVSGFKGLKPKTLTSSVDNVNTNLDLEELRRVYHNSERFLQPEEAKFLHKHGHGLRENYRTNMSNHGRGTDQWNINNQLPSPPSEIQFMSDGTTRNIYTQQPQPVIPIMLGGIDIRRSINGFAPGTSEWNRLNDIIQSSRAKLTKPKAITNKSGLTKEEVLQKVSSKDKDVLSKMSEIEFENTVLKPTGEVVPYESQADLMPHFTGNNNVFAMSPKEYADAFNERLDLLNDIIAKKNKSGVEYKVKGLDENGRLVFYTPPGQKIKTPSPIKNKSFSEIMNTSVLDFFSKTTVIPEGTSTWGVRINPGQWRGEVEDIANTEYYRSIPGLEMSNTTSGVFADNVARKGTGAYESINEYLKKLDLGRVKPGFNSQTDYSRGAWENFIKSGRGMGFYANPRTVYGTMKSVAPYIGLLGAGALQQNKKMED